MSPKRLTPQLEISVEFVRLPPFEYAVKPETTLLAALAPPSTLDDKSSRDQQNFVGPAKAVQGAQTVTDSLDSSMWAVRHRLRSHPAFSKYFWQILL